MEFPSKTIENAINQFKTLPGVGAKTAMRMVLHLLKQEKNQLKEFENAIEGIRERLVFCKECHNISDSEICTICVNTNRENDLICVVQDVRDVLALEATQQFNGKYHILGGIISPIDGVGPDKLNIKSLLERVEKYKVKELIFALSATMEGDTTIYYISKKLSQTKVKITTISRGIAIGGELEYVDEITLGRSVSSRIPYQL